MLDYASMQRQRCLSSKKTLQQITDYEKDNKYSQNPQFQERSARRKCRSQLNHKSFSENIIYDPLSLFSKLTGANNIKIMY